MNFVQTEEYGLIRYEKVALRETCEFFGLSIVNIKVNNVLQFLLLPHWQFGESDKFFLSRSALRLLQKIGIRVCMTLRPFRQYNSTMGQSDFKSFVLVYI